MCNEGCRRAIGFLQLVRRINANCLAVHQKQTNEGSSSEKKKEKKILKVAGPWAEFVRFLTHCRGEQWLSVSEKHHSCGQVAFV